jgi:hypothetical protein
MSASMLGGMQAKQSFMFTCISFQDVVVMLKIHEVACGVSFPQSRLIDAHEGDKLERAMLNYKPGDDVGPLEDWPFENPKSNY